MPVKERDKPMSKAVALQAAGRVAGPTAPQASPSSGPRQPNAIERGRDFLGDVRGELHKVNSPSRAEVQSTTTVVILAVFAFAAFFYIVDSILGYLLQALLHSLGGS